MRYRFVVVDDAGFLREIIKNILVDAGGVCVGEASNGDEAVAIVQATLPDLVILDMVMPQRNGIQTAQAIKELHPEMKIIGCSTIDQETMIQKALAVGFDAYVTKPFSKEDIIKNVTKVFPHLGESINGRT